MTDSSSPATPPTRPHFCRVAKPEGAAPRTASISANSVSGTIRLNKRMAELGLASPRDSDDWIAKGWVKVNGEATMGMQEGPEVKIEINKQAQGQHANQVTILLNKPIDIVCGQAEDGHLPAITLIQPQNRWADDNARFSFTLGGSKAWCPPDAWTLTPSACWS